MGADESSVMVQCLISHFIVSFTRIWSKSESDWNVMTGSEMINIQYIDSNIDNSFRIIKND